MLRVAVAAYCGADDESAPDSAASPRNSDTGRQGLDDTRPRGWRIAIDRGGTFTDIVALSPDGRLLTHKVLSRDPHAPGDAAARGIGEVLARLAQGDRTPLESVRLGTTVATNALLERKGEPTVLVTTRGFRRCAADRLPGAARHLCARDPPSRRCSMATSSRRTNGVDAAGAVLTALDLPQLREGLRAARAQGFDSVAIVFLHGFRYPAHEQQAAALAVELGFAEVVASHQAAAMLGYVARGDTTVADAYLSPVLLRYVREFGREVATRFGAPPLALMQSNGGLVDAAGLRGVNGVLSGPAGGVVGMVAAGVAEGRRRLIGFDMGGTSTDVSLYVGELPRRFVAEIDGVQAAGADDGHQHHRGRRRLDRAARRRQVAGGPGLGRR